MLRGPLKLGALGHCLIGLNYKPPLVCTQALLVVGAMPFYSYIYIYIYSLGDLNGGRGDHAQPNNQFSDDNNNNKMCVKLIYLDMAILDATKGHILCDPYLPSVQCNEYEALGL